jgi:hypothetical protein
MKKKYMAFTFRYISNLIHLGHVIFLCCFFSITLLPSQAQAYKPEIGRVSASTGPFVFDSDVKNNNNNFYPRPRIGYSLLVEAIFAKKSGIEVGLFYLNKPYLRDDGTNFLIQKTTRMYITTSYRYWLCDYFSSAIGIFSSFTMGDPKTLEKSAGLPDDFKTSASSIANYGVDLSLRFEYEIDKKNGLNFDFRYSYSWTQEADELTNHLLAGIFYRRQIDVN